MPRASLQDRIMAHIHPLLQRQLVALLKCGPAGHGFGVESCSKTRATVTARVPRGRLRNIQGIRRLGILNFTGSPRGGVRHARRELVQSHAA